MWCCCLESTSRIQTNRAETRFGSAPQRWNGDSPALSQCAGKGSMPGMSCLQFNNLQLDWPDLKSFDERKHSYSVDFGLEYEQFLMEELAIILDPILKLKACVQP